MQDEKLKIFMFFFLFFYKHVGDSPNLLKDLADGKHPYAKVSNRYLNFVSSSNVVV